MSALFINIYGYLRGRPLLRVLSLLVVTVLMVLLLFKQNYREDISEFLPLSGKYRDALNVYQGISGADRIIIMFQQDGSSASSADTVVKAMELFESRFPAVCGEEAACRLTAQVDLERYSRLAGFVYGHIPSFLEEADYARLDSLLADADYIPRRLANDKQMLMSPTSGLFAANVGRDPLEAFTPVVAALQPMADGLDYELYDGYVFSPDMEHGLLMFSSPYGASETEENAKLLEQLEALAGEVGQVFPNVSVRFVGAPVIAVGNSLQIKKDSLVSVSLAVLLIVVLLFAVFRNVRNILLIVVSIAWGWLFAMGALALLRDNVSVIVVGISSVIIGIAINYPLHLIAHLSHTPDVKSALKEIVSPLLIGNITTVGAFLALVPLKSVALQDLGLFSSFLLIGTILFVLLYLPHLVRATRKQEEGGVAFSRIADKSFEGSRALVWLVLVLTCVFGYFSFSTSFDANINHINYMTAEQRADMAYLQETMTNARDQQTVYVVSSDTSFDAAVARSEGMQPLLRAMVDERRASEVKCCHRFVLSAQEQGRRLLRWRSFVDRYGERLEREVRSAALAEGFAESSFDDFYALLGRDFEVMPPDSFASLYASAFSNFVVADSANGRFHIVTQLQAAPSALLSLEQRVDTASAGVYAFDVAGMNSSIAASISDDFNYIGWACGLIVFLFLWFSFGNIELVMLSFLPMAVSWVWILGIMALFHIQFNVVNVILATFIFGQGDDYTIFMTEGSQYEYAYQRKMLTSYRSSIFVSALIMFIGMGTLILARHPALHSLGEVTIVGMFSVVLMAFLFPPLIFKWLVYRRGEERRRPLTLSAFANTVFCGFVFFLQLALAYIVGFALLGVLRPTVARRRKFRRLVNRCFRLDMASTPRIRFCLQNEYAENFSRPAVVICNHQSFLDTAYLMALSPNIAIVANEGAGNNVFIRQIFKWLDYYIIPKDGVPADSPLDALSPEGRCVVFFPEGRRNPGSSVLRFHKGAFLFAEEHGLDIIPVFLHGANDVFPRGSLCAYPGSVSVIVGRRIPFAEWRAASGDYAEATRAFHRFYVETFRALKAEKEDANYFAGWVKDTYRYRGADIRRAVNKNLNRFCNYAAWTQCDADAGGTLAVVNAGWGEFPILLALTHPEIKVVAFEADADKFRVAANCAAHLCQNLTIIAKPPAEELLSQLGEAKADKVFLLSPADGDEALLRPFSPTVVN